MTRNQAKAILQMRIIKAFTRGAAITFIASELTNAVVNKVEKEGGVKAVLLKGKNEVSNLTSSLSSVFTSLQAKASNAIKTAEKAGQEGNVIDGEAVEVEEKPVVKKKPVSGFTKNP